MDLTKWWADWQSLDHARKFDFRASVPDRILIRDLESFNDVRLLNEILDAPGKKSLLEVGCATGDFYRYLRLRHSDIAYTGIDVSRTAVERATAKYPSARFHAVYPDWSAGAITEICGGRPQIVFSKDVVHHQVKPLQFLTRLLELPSESLVFRTRTRDAGATEWDPEKSCQFHYGGWMPYIVINFDELVAYIRQFAAKAEITIYRNHMVLGGQHNRYLPKDCYLPQTGTAETAVRVSLLGSSVGRVSVMDRRDSNPQYSVYEMLMLGMRKLGSIMRAQ